MPAGGQSRSDLNYQIALGQSPFFWSVFPMGARQGSSSELTLRGDFLQVGTPVRFSAPGLQPQELRAHWANVARQVTFACQSRSAQTTEPGAYDLGVSDDSGTLAPLKLIVGDLPEMTETEPNDTVGQSQPLNGALTVNGRIGS